MGTTSDREAPVQVELLEYPRASPLNRRHFRLLLALTLLNTFLIVGGFLFAPLIQSTTGKFWQDVQRKRAEQRAQKQFLSRYQQCADFAQPPTTVIYDEEPARAARLYSAGGYRQADRGGGSYTYIPPRPWQVPVAAAPPAVAAQMANLRGQSGTIFLHAMRTSSGKERLVEVYIDATQRMRGYGDDHQRKYTVATDRTIEAGVYELDRIVVMGLSRTQLRFARRAMEGPVEIVWNKEDSWEHGSVQFMPQEVLRVFAGQPDPVDRSHFTFVYDIDGKPGTIDGRLNDDDTLTLQPRQGRALDRNSSGTAVVWEFPGQPTTQVSR